MVGVSCFDGMANSMRVRNLFEPLVNKDLISLHNLIYQKNNKEPIGKKGEINNISFKVIGFRLSNIFTLFSFFFGGIFFLNKSKLPKYKNLLYVFDYPDIKNIWFILYAKLIGYKIILDIVEDNRFEAHVGVINKFRIKTSLVLIKTCKYIADSMIGISGHLYKRLLSVSRGKVPVFLIPITVNLNYFKNTIYSADKKNIKIFYGGSYGQKDGLEYLISAFDEVNKKTTNVELILTGIGHKLDMDRINLQINKSINKDRILYKGFLSTDDYYAVLNECDIFCMTRVNSKFANAGFPFKLGEFLASGKAVIATNVGDVSNYLFNGVNALVINPDSVDELAKALLSLIEDPCKISLLGIEGRKTAETHFDSDKVSMRLLEIFKAA